MATYGFKDLLVLQGLWFSIPVAVVSLGAISEIIEFGSNFSAVLESGKVSSEIKESGRIFSNIIEKG